MINDSSDRKLLTEDVNTARVEMSADDASFFFAPPVNKLDADQYIVQDQDGSGESLYGSGNLNYLALQASQADALLSEQARMAGVVGGNEFINNSFAGNAIPTIPAISGNDFGGLSNGGITSGPLSFAGLGMQDQVNQFSTFSGSRVQQGNSNSSSTTTASSESSSSTTTTTNEGGNTITITNNNTNNNTTINNNYAETNLFDTINNTVNNVSDITNNAVTNLFDTVNNTVNNVSSVVSSLTNILDGGPGGLPGLPELPDLLPDLLPPSNPGDTDLGVHTGISVVDQLTSGLEATPVVSIVEDLVGDTDNALHVGLGLLGTNDATGPDSDVTGQIGIDIVDQTLANTNLNVNLDPIEAIVGDVDVDLSSVTNLLGHMADPILDNGMGGTTGSILSPVGETLGDVVQSILPQGNDSDLNVDLGLGIVDTHLADVGQSVNLDVVEELINHDINIDIASDLMVLGHPDTGLPNISQEGIWADLNNKINQALDVINQTGDPLGVVAGGTVGVDLNDTLSFNSWTDNAHLPDVNNVLSSVLDQLANTGGAATHAIPEPVGSLSEGLGGLFNANHGPVLGGHHGGLFG